MVALRKRPRQRRRPPYASTALGGLIGDPTWDPILLLAYGSNACPGRLAEKFAVGGDVTSIDGIVLIGVEMYGVARAWARKVNSRRVVPATLARDVDDGSPAFTHTYSQQEARRIIDRGMHTAQAGFTPADELIPTKVPLTCTVDWDVKDRPVRLLFEPS